MSPEFISLYRAPFMIFGVVLLLRTGHCFEQFPAILHNDSGEQEIASLMQINSGRGKNFDDNLPFLGKVKCEHTVGHTGSPPLDIHPEIAPISQPIDAIPCKLCVVHSTPGPVIYALVQHDGLGSRLMSVLLNLAIAWNRSFSFGGFIESPNMFRSEDSDSGEKVHQLLSVLLGFDYNQLRAPSQRLDFETCVSFWRLAAPVQLQRLDLIPQGTKSIFLSFLVAPGLAADSVFTPGFLQKWRTISGLQKVPATHFQKCGINIALHVRRGDVNQGRWPDRFVKDEVHIQVAQTVQAFLPHSCVHVFSSTVHHENGQQTYSPSDFMKYHLAGIHVHLDNPEIDDMAHFAKADVTICTTGNFCGSVSMLNPKCVLVSKKKHSRIPGLNRILYDTSNGMIDLEEQNNLHHCLQTQVLKVKDKTTVWYIVAVANGREKKEFLLFRAKPILLIPPFHSLSTLFVTLIDNVFYSTLPNVGIGLLRLKRSCRHQPAPILFSFPTWFCI